MPVLKGDPPLEIRSRNERIVYYVKRTPRNVGKRPDYDLKECLWRFDGQRSECVWCGYVHIAQASPSGNRIAMQAEQLMPWSNESFTRGFAILDVVK